VRLELEDIDHAERRQRQHREPEDGGARAFRLADLAQRNRHDRDEQRGHEPDKAAEQRELAAAGLGNDEDAREADDHRAPAMPAGLLAQHECAEDGREDRDGELECRRLGERQQQHRAEGEDHAGEADRGAGEVRAEALGADRAEAGAHHDPRSDDRHCPELAVKHRLDKRRAPRFGELDECRHGRQAGDCEQPQQDALQYVIALHTVAFAARRGRGQPSAHGLRASADRPARTARPAVP
jgi:hypothetical protein